MKRVAKASNPGRCANAKCDQSGALIFEHLGQWRLLACSMRCALIAHREIEKVPEDLHPILFDAGRSSAEKMAAIEKSKKGVDF